MSAQHACAIPRANLSYELEYLGNYWQRVQLSLTTGGCHIDWCFFLGTPPPTTDGSRVGPSMENGPPSKRPKLS